MPSGSSTSPALEGFNTQRKNKAWDEWRKAIKIETPERLTEALENAIEAQRKAQADDGWAAMLPDCFRWLKDGCYTAALEDNPAQDNFCQSITDSSPDGLSTRPEQAGVCRHRQERQGGHCPCYTPFWQPGPADQPDKMASSPVTLPWGLRPRRALRDASTSRFHLHGPGRYVLHPLAQEEYLRVPRSSDEAPRASRP